MSLYGALYAGVAGLQAQSNKLGIISDNIANVNTVGYKEGSATFETLVTNASNATAYSPGGVLSGNQQLINTQGLLQTTSSPTDIAISGAGLFVVNQTADGNGQVLYTRAASFTQDAQGDFVNTAGYFLQAWPLDSNGLLPGSPGNVTNTTSSANLSSLVTVNVQNVTGTASATTKVALSANLNSGQTASLGAGATAGMDSLDAANTGITANQLIIPTGVDSLTRGDVFSVSTSLTSLSENFTYGGFAVGRDVVNDVAGTATPGGDAATALPSNTPVNLANPPATTGVAGSSTVIIHTTGGAALPVAGQVVTLAGIAAVGGITAPQLAGQFIVQTVGAPGANDFTITTTGTVGAGQGGTNAAAGGTEVVRPFAGNILDANTASQTFLGTTGTTNFTPSALSFTVHTAATGTVTFNYTQSAPNSLLGQFNNLTNLATAINDVNGLTARVQNGTLYVGATDANAAVTFANGSTQGVSGPPVQGGIDWVNELGLANVAANNPTISGTNLYSSLQSLSNDVNSIPGLTATITNPTGASSLTINDANPLDTITFNDGPSTGANGNTGSPLAALGFTGIASNNSHPAVQTSTGSLGPAYNPTDTTKNMASGSTPAQFSRPITVFDSLGASHNLNVAFLKTGSNTWAVEIYSQPGTDVSQSTTLDGSSDGLVASGTLVFNGDGTLRNVSGTIASAFPIDWTNGSNPSSIAMNWGTDGAANGLSQFDSDYNVNSVNQNGTPVGQLTGVSIDSSGIITASFNNGQTQKLYQIPLAEFADPNQLQSISGNAYEQTSGSGIVNLKQSGQSGVGTISSGALEQSNVELANQLTDMIVAQRAYQANTKVIQTADTLLNDLDQILQ